MRDAEYVTATEFQRSFGAMIFNVTTDGRDVVVVSRKRAVAALIPINAYREFVRYLRERERVTEGGADGRD